MLPRFGESVPFGTSPGGDHGFTGLCLYLLVVRFPVAALNERPSVHGCAYAHTYAACFDNLLKHTITCAPTNTRVSVTDLPGHPAVLTP